jgi:hypothetical protein
LERCERCDKEDPKAIARMETLMQGAELGDDGELVFFHGETDQRTSEDPVLVQFRLEGVPGKLMMPEVQIQV